MRRLVLVLAAPLLFGGCMFPQGWHWARTAATGSPTTTETVVYWQNDVVSYQGPVVAWAASYYNGHPEVRVVMVDTCPTGRNCVVWRTGRNGGGVTSLSIGGNRHVVASTVTLDAGVGKVDTLTQARKLVFHEACHSFGAGFTPPGAASIHEFCNWEWRTLMFAELGKAYHDDAG